MYGLITTRQRNFRKVMFSVVSICLFRGGGDVPVHGPAPRACWKFLNLDLTVQAPPPPPDTFRFVHYKAQTVGKQAVGNGLKCLLVNHMILYCDSYCDCDLPKYIILSRSEMQTTKVCFHLILRVVEDMFWGGPFKIKVFCWILLIYDFLKSKYVANLDANRQSYRTCAG